MVRRYSFGNLEIILLPDRYVLKRIGKKLEKQTTALVRARSGEGQNHGVMLKERRCDGKFCHIFRSGATTLSPPDTTRPYITLADVDNEGLEPYWDYRSASAGRAGPVHVNSFTGAPTLTHPYAGSSGNQSFNGPG